jgi:N-terminal domain of toast_rack, DUF2154
MEGDFSYNVADWKPRVSYDVSGDEGELIVRQGGAESSNPGGEARKEWEIRLNDEVATDSPTGTVKAFAPCAWRREMGIVELEQCEADGEDVALVLAVRLMELVAQPYRRVAHFGREDASRVESSFGPRGDHKSAHRTNRIGLCAPCACVRAGL